MKPHPLFCLIFVLFSTQVVQSQDFSENPKSKLMVTDAFINFGSFSEQVSYSGLDDFRKLAPESEMFNQDLSDFSRQASGSYYNGGAFFSAAVGIKFYDEKKESYRANPLLRVGVSYVSSNPVVGSVSRTESFVVDTLVSSSTGEIALVDSTVTEGYNMSYSADQIRLNASLVFRTNPEARWSLYGGVGFAGGVSINSQTQISYSITEFDEETNSGAGTFETEEFDNQTSFAMMAYLPFGLDFRLGNNEFWQRTHLFYELAPGLNMTFIPELDTQTSTAISHGIGLRVNWN